MSQICNIVHDVCCRSHCVIDLWCFNKMFQIMVIPFEDIKLWLSLLKLHYLEFQVV